MDICFRVQLSSRLNEGVDKVIIFLTPSARLLEAKIEVVFQKFLAVGATVQNDGQRSIRMDASAKCGEDQLGHRDQNSSHTLIADTKNFLPICGLLASHRQRRRLQGLTRDHDIVDIIRGSPLSQVIVDTADVIDVQKASLGFAEESRVVLDCISFRWCVDDREHFFEVVLD
jgi:hypothetical protein